MEIVEATVADAERLQTFIRKAWTEAGPGAPGFSGATEETINEISSQEFHRNRLLDSRVRIFAAQFGKEFVGFASTREIDKRTLELSGIMVLEATSGKGVGTRLIEAVKSSASKRDYREILVKTEADNQRAINLYKRTGFNQTSETTEDVEGTLVKLMTLRLTIT